MIAKDMKTDKNGRFAFTNLDIKETSMVRINLEKEKKRRSLGFGIELDTLSKKPYFPIVPLEDYLYESEEIDSLMFGYEEKRGRQQLSGQSSQTKRDSSPWRSHCNRTK